MASAQPLVDHDRIRKWAETRGARPACVKGTGGKNDPGMLRLDFPGYSGEESLQSISWNDWFRRFDERNLALLVQDRTARGGRMSNFNKLVERGAASRTARSRKTSSSGGRKTASKPRGRRQTSSRRAAAASSRRMAGKSTRSSRSRSTAGSRKKTASAGGRRRRQSSSAG